MNEGLIHKFEYYAQWNNNTDFVVQILGYEGCVTLGNGLKVSEKSTDDSRTEDKHFTVYL